ncbi:MAG: hypothetical protein DI603_15185 [Roseateles depolymerans]|uniref:Uncharacterized protein n=1 Tax=Roseateles depolymerans TaxID=76731 RepID=A0A2W5DF07_9BURK|nr:MAG: hypothetical protein DI603_15185 [Roseateles depolymerans]
MTPPLCRVELSDEQLREAWEQLRQTRTHWPADFSQAMEHPLVSRVLRIEAALRTRGVAASSTRPSPAPAPAPAVAPQPYWRPYRNTNTPAADRKRAAAADLDD